MATYRAQRCRLSAMCPDRILFAGSNENHLALLVPIMQRFGPARCDILSPLMETEARTDGTVGPLLADGFHAARPGERYGLAVTDATSLIRWEGRLRPATDLWEVAERVVCVTHNLSIPPDLTMPCMHGFLAPHSASVGAGIRWMRDRDPHYAPMAEEERRERRHRWMTVAGGGPLIVWVLPPAALDDAWMAIIEQTAREFALVVKLHPLARCVGDALSAAVPRSDDELAALVQIADLVVLHPGAAASIEQCVWFGTPWLPVATIPMGLVSERVAWAARRRAPVEAGDLLEKLRATVVRLGTKNALADAAAMRRVFYEREVAVAGPFHLDFVQQRPIDPTVSARVARAAGLSWEESRPIVVWFEYTGCRVAEAASTLARLARACSVIVKPLATPHSDARRLLAPEVGMWPSGRLVPNELRAAADFVIAHPHSSTFVSSLLMGCRVVAMYGTDERSSIRSPWTTYGLVDALGGAMSTACPDAVAARLSNAPYWTWYDATLPRIREQCLEQCTPLGALDRAVELLEEFHAHGTFGQNNRFPIRPWQL